MQDLLHLACKVKRCETLLGSIQVSRDAQKVDPGQHLGSRQSTIKGPEVANATEDRELGSVVQPLRPQMKSAAQSIATSMAVLPLI